MPKGAVCSSVVFLFYGQEHGGYQAHTVFIGTLKVGHIVSKALNSSNAKVSFYLPLLVPIIPGLENYKSIIAEFSKQFNGEPP